MALGDNDIAAGVFFADFGDTLLFGSQPAAMGNVDAPAKDAMFDHVSVGNVTYTVECSATAFNPMPRANDPFTIATGRCAGRYSVQSVDALTDGAVVQIKLRKI